MEKLSAESTPVPLLTGIIGEAVLELIERSMIVSQEGIVTMLEKKKSVCTVPSAERVIDYAIVWMRKGAVS